MKKPVLLTVLVMGGMLSLAASGGKPAGQNGLFRALMVNGAMPPVSKIDSGHIPLQFIPNRGQAGGEAAFYVLGSDKSIFFTPAGLRLELGAGPSQRWGVRLDFVNANKNATLVGRERSGAVVSYFKGRPQDWKTAVPVFSKIAYMDIWPGIDLIYSGSVDRMKYEFVVRPGADPGRIKLAYVGAQTVRLTSEGRLEVETPVGSFQDDIPTAYQDVDGRRVDVRVAYALGPDVQGSSGGASNVQIFTYGFHVGEYDRNKTLILDPAVLVNCGFIGGSGADVAHDIAVDGEGNIYIVGETSSTDLSVPGALGLDPAYHGGDSDAFVAKLNPEGTALIYCGYIGGLGADRAAALAVDSEGSVYIAGTTGSPETSFPVTVGPDLTYNGGESDAFVAKLGADGSGLNFCGYIGGAGKDSASTVAWTMAGDWGAQLPVAFVAGSTSSTEATFPVAGGPDLTYNGGETDGFVAKLKADGSGIDCCGYIGGSGNDVIAKLAAGRVGFISFEASAYVVGSTSSTEATFPVAGGPDLTYNGGESDAFIAQVKTDWTGLEFCGYIGGAGTDVATDLVLTALSEGGDFPFTWIEKCVAGYTSSTETTFPVTVGPDLTYNGGEYDAFVALLGRDWFYSLSCCGYIGGAGSDVGTRVIRGSSGVLVAGNTSSTESTFPIAYGSDPTYNGGASDIFLAKLTADWRGIASSGYLGGAGTDNAAGLAFSSGGDVLIAGSTDSTEATFPVAGGPDLAYHGGAFDAFLARVHMKAPTLTSLSRTEAVVGDPGFTLTVTGANFMDGASVRWTGKSLPTTLVSDSELQAAVDAGDLALPAYVYVCVDNPDHEASGPIGFTIRPGPLTLTSLSPAQASAGGGNFVLSLQGSGFVPVGGWYGFFFGPVVLWNGVEKYSYYVSYNELQVDIAPSDIATGGEVQVVVKGYGQDIADSNTLVFPVASFSVAPSPATRTVTAGQAATYGLGLTPQFGSFDSEVSLTCLGLPDKCTASFSPSKITPGGSSVSSTLTLKTTAPTAAATAAAISPAGRDVLLAALWLVFLLAGMRMLLRRRVYAYRPLRWLACSAALFWIILISACSLDDPGPRHEKGTPAGTYNVSIKATSGNLVVTSSVELVVK